MKWTKSFAICFLILLFSSSIRAQTIDSSQHKKTIGLHVGSAYNLYLDQQTSPLIYKANGLLFGINYSKMKVKSLVDFTMEYGNLDVVAKYHKNRTLFKTPERGANGNIVKEDRVPLVKLHHIYLRFAYFKSINLTSSKRVTTYLGGSFATNARIPLSDDVVLFTPIGINELNIALKTSYEFNSKLKLSLSAELPVLAINIRLPYSISPVEPNKGVYLSSLSHTKIVTWNKYQAGRASMQIDYNANRRFGFLFNLSCSYFSYDYPKRINFLQTNSKIGINYSF
jgi:hypothetical protein